MRRWKETNVRLGPTSQRALFDTFCLFSQKLLQYSYQPLLEKVSAKILTERSTIGAWQAVFVKEQINEK